jgi:hypothetical protein
MVEICDVWEMKALVVARREHPRNSFSHDVEVEWLHDIVAWGQHPLTTSEH